MRRRGSSGAIMDIDFWSQKALFLNHESSASEVRDLG